MTRVVRRGVLAALAVTAVTLLAIVTAGWSPRVEYVLAVAFALVLAVVAIRRLMGSVSPPSWPSPLVRRAAPAGVDPRIGVIESSLRHGLDDAGVCRRRVQPMLVELAIHRLARHRGIGLVEDPDAARRMLGDEPFRFLTEVVEDPPAAATLAQTVMAVERL